MPFTRLPAVDWAKFLILERYDLGLRSLRFSSPLVITAEKSDS